MAEDSIENGIGGAPRKPWATPDVIVSERVSRTAKTTPAGFDTHITAPGMPNDSNLQGSVS